jgi:hypothetical protein
VQCLRWRRRGALLYKEVLLVVVLGEEALDPLAERLALCELLAHLVRVRARVTVRARARVRARVRARARVKGWNWGWGLGVVP